MLKSLWEASLDKWLCQVAAQGRGGRMGSRRWVEGRGETPCHRHPSRQDPKAYGREEGRS
jgi:hypothetical protein